MFCLSLSLRVSLSFFASLSSSLSSFSLPAFPYLGPGCLGFGRRIRFGAVVEFLETTPTPYPPRRPTRSARHGRPTTVLDVVGPYSLSLCSFLCRRGRHSRGPVGRSAVCAAQSREGRSRPRTQLTFLLCRVVLFVVLFFSALCRATEHSVAATRREGPAGVLRFVCIAARWRLSASFRFPSAFSSLLSVVTFPVRF